MENSLEVEIFEWPDRFFVEAESVDRDYTFFFPLVPKEVYPHFVDLEVYETGWCSCRDFRMNVEPYLTLLTARRECKHILAAQKYRNQFTEKPKQMPRL